ncbi:MAG: right-handed parallel beta-helix repeat-containing protein [Candidatus Hodarchaeales archaeon]
MTLNRTVKGILILIPLLLYAANKAYCLSLVEIHNKDSRETIINDVILSEEITEIKEYTNSSILLLNSITIRNGGELMITNSNITANHDTGSISIIVGNGGILTIHDSRVNENGSIFDEFNIIVLDDGKLTLDNCSVFYIGSIGEEEYNGIYIEGVNSLIQESSMNYVDLTIKGNNFTFVNNQLFKSSTEIIESSFCEFINNTFQECFIPLKFSRSNFNTIHDNSIVKFTINAISLYHSDSNVIAQNNISYGHDDGLYMYDCESSLIESNYIHNNDGMGIRLSSCASISIKNNSIYFNHEEAVNLLQCNDIEFVNNTDYFGNTITPSIKENESFNVLLDLMFPMLFLILVVLLVAISLILIVKKNVKIKLPEKNDLE